MSSKSISIPLLNSEISSNESDIISLDIPTLKVKNGKVIIPYNLKLKEGDKLQIRLINTDTDQPYDGTFFVKCIDRNREYDVWDDTRKINFEYKIETIIQYKNKVNRCFTIIAISIMLIIITSHFVLAIISGVVANESENDESNTCFNFYNEIKISYITWLKVFCITTLTITGLIMLFIGIDIHTRNADTRKTILEKIARLLNALGVIFEIFWYVIGSIIYFQTIYPNCQGTMIYDFGFTLFIIQTISAVCFYIIGCVSHTFKIHPCINQVRIE